MKIKVFTRLRALLDEAEDASPIWRAREVFEDLTPTQREILFTDMAVRGWERKDRIFLPCGLVWERMLSEDGTAWLVADITAQLFP